MILLDTHVLLWVDSDGRKLGRQSRSLIDRAWKSNGLAVSALSFWEAAVLCAKRRIRLPMPITDWRRKLLAAGLIEWPLDGEIALRANDLTTLPTDPVDRFIVATALCRNLDLMTADEPLLDWRHALQRHDARV
jgi:PIN domain nuclease of toxin-antitoxin system